MLDIMENVVYENEITVEVDLSIGELKQLLDDNGFTVKNEYDINDIYMIKKECRSHNPLKMLKDSVLIRNVIGKEKNTKKIVYKHKEYNSNEEITKQANIECQILSIADAHNLLTFMGYNDLITINDHITVYANSESEFAIEEVNDKHLYIEIEQKCRFINRVYDSIEELMTDFSRYNIPIKNNNYFAKKAEDEIKEVYKIGD